MSDIDPDPYLERDDFEELNANEASDYKDEHEGWLREEHKDCDDEDFEGVDAID